MPDGELADYLNEVESTFGKLWLSEPNGKDKIQRLWLRNDGLSTIELVTLGYGIKTLKQLHPKWLKSCIQDIKSQDANRQNGALFELHAITMLITAKMNIKPAAYGTPGLDATIAFDDKAELLLSIKNHDISYHEQLLQENCKIFRERARELFSAQGFTGIDIMLTAKEYITDSNWQKLLAILQNYQCAERNGLIEILPGIHLRIVPLVIQNGLTLSKKYFSDWFIALIPYHKNEQPNFMSKIETAALQLKKQCQNMEQKKGCLIRVHPTADISRLRNISIELLNRQPPINVDFVALYQPAVTIDTVNDTTALSHYLTIIPSPSWNTQLYLLKFGALIGVSTPNPTKLKLGFPDGSLKDCTDHYIFQMGSHFVEMEQNDHGEFTVNMSRRAGLSIYPIFNGIIADNIFPPEDSLLTI